MCSPLSTHPGPLLARFSWCGCGMGCHRHWPLILGAENSGVIMLVYPYGGMAVMGACGGSAYGGMAAVRILAVPPADPIDHHSPARNLMHSYAVAETACKDPCMLALSG